MEHKPNRMGEARYTALFECLRSSTNKPSGQGQLLGISWTSGGEQSEPDQMQVTRSSGKDVSPPATQTAPTSPHLSVTSQKPGLLCTVLIGEAK
jgi:hypothetical protein